MTFTQASRKRDRTFHFRALTNIHTFSYRDVFCLVLVDLFVITRLIADRLCKPSEFAFNPTRIELLWDWKEGLVAKKLLFSKEIWQQYSSVCNKSKYEKILIYVNSVITWWLHQWNHDVMFLTSWKNYFFTELIIIVLNMFFLLQEICYSDNYQFSQLYLWLQRQSNWLKI